MEILRQWEQWEHSYKPVKVGNFFYSNYIEYESRGDRNKSLSVKGYLKEIKFYLMYIIINLQKSNTWKTEITISINFISSKDE